MVKPIIKAGVKRAEDALYQQAGTSRDELNQATRDRWTKEAPKDALKGDWEQFKLEWQAKMPLLIGFGVVMLIVLLIAMR